MKILLADDSMTAQNMGKKILTDAGYEVVAVSNGAAAVKKIAEQRPDVAVLDVYMPGYTGLEVCERLKAAHDTTHMPVLLTVGRMEPFKPEEGSRVKADGIIIKPFEASDLLAAIQKIEQRLTPARPMAAAAGSSDPTTIYEKTQKIQIPYLTDFKDASYEEWKVSAPGHTEEGEPRAAAHTKPAFSVPEAMQASPAMGMDELEIVPALEPEPQPQSQRVTQAIDSLPITPAPRSAQTTHIERKPEPPPPPLPPAPAAAQPQPAAKSVSGVWRALDKARDWFGNAPESSGTAKDESALAHIADLPEEKLAEAFSAAPAPEIAEAAFQPAPEPVFEAPPVPEKVKTIHELAYEAVQSYGAKSDSPQPPAFADELVVHTPAAAPTRVPPARDPHLEIAPAVHLKGEEIAADPDLEPTVRSSEAAPTIVTTDPGLVTDVNELASGFPTRFGVANPDDVPVGIASNFPHLYADASTGSEAAAHDSVVEELEPAASVEVSAPKLEPNPKIAAPVRETPPPAKSAWVAQETTLDAYESGLKLHDEMHQAFANLPSAAAAEDVSEVELLEPDTQASEEASEVGSAVDPELAAAMAAAVGAEVAPSVAKAVSESAKTETAAEEDKTALVADIVQRVVDMMKPELIRRISSELGKKK